MTTQLGIKITLVRFIIYDIYRLEFYDVSIEGAYTCISNLSGQLKKFVLTPGKLLNS